MRFLPLIGHCMGNLNTDAEAARLLKICARNTRFFMIKMNITCKINEIRYVLF
jgi:hypothetical protein